MKESEKPFDVYTTDHITVDPNKCRSCFKCRGIFACPKDVLGRTGSWRKRTIVCHPENCIGCMKCVKACRRGAFGKR